MWLTTGNALSDWRQVSLTWDRSGDLVLYENCVEVDRQPMSTGTFENRSVTERYIGRPSEATRWWNGMMDEIRIYDTVLSGQEIAAVFCPERRHETQVIAAFDAEGGEFFGGCGRR